MFCVVMDHRIQDWGGKAVDYRILFSACIKPSFFMKKKKIVCLRTVICAYTSFQTPIVWSCLPSVFV